MPSAKPEKSVAQNAAHMGMATFLSRIFGLVREQVFAFLFGATDAADAFNIAFRIPNLLRDLFAEGAMSAAFVPEFSKSLTTSKQKAFKLFIAVSSLLFMIVTGISIFGIIFAKPLALLYAGAYQNIPGKFELTVDLTQLMFPFFPLVALAAISMGALNALGSFFIPAFAPALFNIVSILSGFFICPFLGIHGMAIGVVLGGFFQLLIQWIQFKNDGDFRLSDFWLELRQPWKTPGVSRVFKLLIPGTIGLAATQLNILMNSIYATSCGSGALSWLNYAFRLMQFPIGIFGVSLAAATLPAVSKKLALQQPLEAVNEIKSSLKTCFAINLVASAGLVAISLPLVQLLFQHGKFEFLDSQSTAQAVIAYAFGLTGYSVVKILVPLFYSLQKTRTPVLISFAMVGLNVALNHLFIYKLGLSFESLAISTSITATLNAVLLLFFLNALLKGILHLELLFSLTKHFLLACAVGGVAYFSQTFIGTIFVNYASHLFFLKWCTQVFATVALSGLTWLGLSKAFKIEENLKWITFIKRRLKRP